MFLRYPHLGIDIFSPGSWAWAIIANVKMNHLDYFKPGPLCGNCAFYASNSDPRGYHSGAHCRKGLEPGSCGSEFRPRGKKVKIRKVKPWQK